MQQKDFGSVEASPATKKGEGQVSEPTPRLSVPQAAQKARSAAEVARLKIQAEIDLACARNDANSGFDLYYPESDCGALSGEAFLAARQAFFAGWRLGRTSLRFEGHVTEIAAAYAGMIEAEGTSTPEPGSENVEGGS